MTLKSLLLFTTVFCLIGCQDYKNQTNSWNYPKIRSESASEIYFGKEIIDPYRNIEDINSTEVKGWLKKQRDFCDSTLTNITNYASLKKEIEGYLKTSQIKGGFPRPINEKLFYVKQDVSTNIHTLFYHNETSNETTELFNTEELNKINNAVHSISYYEPSPNGNFLAFGMYADGSETSHIYILDVKKQQLLPDKIEKSACYNPQWLHDESGFFYSRLKELKTKKDSMTMFDDVAVFFHRLRTHESDDKLIINKTLHASLKFKSTQLPLLYTYQSTRNVFLELYDGVSPYMDLYYTNMDDLLKKQSQQIKWIKIREEKDKIKHTAPSKNSVYTLSFKANSYGKLVKIDLTAPYKETVVFENKEYVLEEIAITRNALYVNIIHNGLNKIASIDLASNKHEFIQLPFNGTINLTPSFAVPLLYIDNDKLFFKAKSWNKSSELYSYDPQKGTVTNLNILRPNALPLQNDLIVEEIKVNSYDGTKVPLSLIHPPNIKRNGQNPLVIYAYGSYGHAIKPYFNSHRMAWYNRGVIFAVAHVRGGGEKGDNWHKAGIKTKKHNSWKDLIACTEYLIENKYTNPLKIIAKGESAGGIPIGRAIQERPELFKAAVIKVGALNPLRDEPTMDTGHINEYGSIKDSLEFLSLYNMDVYHQINDSVEYPSIYLTAGLNDYRVKVWQPAKVAARLQASELNKNPVLFRVSKEGHFNGSDYSQELTDEYSFIFWQLGIEGFGYSNSN